MTFFKRALGAAAVTALLASSAVAGTAPLPAGKPAGTKEAALIGGPFLLIGIAIAVAVIAVSVGGGDDNITTPTTTGTTS